MLGYWALIHEENGAFGISFPDVPGCVSAADSMEEAILDGQQALSSHLAWMKDDGDVLPVARSYDALKRDTSIAEDAQGAIWQFVTPHTVTPPRVRVQG
jgi:predicted RNase H-like HicB family nuclease